LASAASRIAVLPTSTMAANWDQNFGVSQQGRKLESSLTAASINPKNGGAACGPEDAQGEAHVDPMCAVER
ncbi:hypothetical protein C8R45DRAFT_949145, partial [Mycena sanguinolenta]